MNAKKERFERVATARVNKITSMIRLLGNCSNGSNYEYNELEVEKILFYLQKELDRLKDRFLEAMYNKKAFSLNPNLVPEEYPTIYQPFPDGRAIRARAIDDSNYPTIEIELVDKEGNLEKVCMVEYNPDRGEGKEVCIGTYSEDVDDPTYYYSYYDKSDGVKNEFKKEQKKSETKD